MVRIYVIGISILIVAIIANFIAKIIGISTWYDFLNSFTDPITSNFKFIDYLGLTKIYKEYLLKIIKKIFNRAGKQKNYQINLF